MYLLVLSSSRNLTGAALTSIPVKSIFGLGAEMGPTPRGPTKPTATTYSLQYGGSSHVIVVLFVFFFKAEKKKKGQRRENIL